MTVYNATPNHKLFTGGTWGILTAENPGVAPEVQGGNQALESLLQQQGLAYEPIRGRYQGQVENSYIVHGVDADTVKNLGRQLGQTSVIHSQSGQHRLHYVNGENRGRWHETQADKPLEFFTQAPEDDWSELPGHGYFRLNFDWNHLHDDTSLQKGLRTSEHATEPGWHHDYPWHDGHTDFYPQDPEVHAHQSLPLGALVPWGRTDGSTDPQSLRFYGLENKLPEIEALARDSGYKHYLIGGPHGNPEHDSRNYNNYWLPIWEPQGGKSDRDYNLAWRLSHELAHALTEPQVNSIYGQARRQGKLGPRSLKEVQRALHWEALAVAKQRELLAKVGVHIQDSHYERERNLVLADGLHRVLTGRPLQPLQHRFSPGDRHIPLWVAFDRLRGTQQQRSPILRKAWPRDRKQNQEFADNDTVLRDLYGQQERVLEDPQGIAGLSVSPAYHQPPAATLIPHFQDPVRRGRYSFHYSPDQKTIMAIGSDYGQHDRTFSVSPQGEVRQASGDPWPEMEYHLQQHVNEYPLQVPPGLEEPPLAKMAIADIPAGAKLGNSWNYTHLLPLPLRSQYLLRVSRSQNHLRVHLLSRFLKSPRKSVVDKFALSQISGTMNFDPALVGGIRAKIMGPDLDAPHSHLISRHRGRGLGLKMYEALYRQAMALGVKEVHGDIHSTDSHRVHEALARKHGLQYHAWPSHVVPAELRGPEDDPSGWKDTETAYDGAYGPYSYALKSEAQKRSPILRKNLNPTPVLHSEVRPFIDSLASMDRAQKGRAITAHMNHAPFLRALQAHPQGKQIHAKLMSYLDGRQNAGFVAGKTKVTVKSEVPLNKMAIADIKPAVAKEDPSGLYDSIHDYSHILSPLQRKSYRLRIYTDESDTPMRGASSDSENNAKFLALLTLKNPPAASLFLRQAAAGEYFRSSKYGHLKLPVVGEALGSHCLRHAPPGGHDEGLYIHYSELKAKHRHKGLGLKMYEALYRHALSRGLKAVLGSSHSTSASRVHEALARKHGLEYKAVRNPNITQVPGSHEYDSAFEPYDYAIKSEASPVLKRTKRLAKMAMADLQAGKPFGENLFDYSHIMSPVHRRRLKLIVKQHSNGFEGYLIPRKGSPKQVPTDTLWLTPERVGVLHVGTAGKNMKVLNSHLALKYRGKGLGLKLYEAVFTHGLKNGYQTVSGDIHSTDSHRVHEALARKHGLEFQALDLGGVPRHHRLAVDDSQTAYDNRYGQYSYALKSELAKMAIADLPAGQKHRNPLPYKSEGGSDRTWFDYSHLLTPVQALKHRLYVTVENSDNYGLHAAILVHKTPFYSSDPEAEENYDIKILTQGALPETWRLSPEQRSRLHASVGGVVTGEPGPESLEVLHSFLRPSSRKQGLGLKMYEALYRHALSVGVKKILGHNHSSLAHKTHEALARKHGLEYKAFLRPYKESMSYLRGNLAPGEYDSAYGPYSYALKSETSKKRSPILRKAWPRDEKENQELADNDAVLRDMYSQQTRRTDISSTY